MKDKMMNDKHKTVGQVMESLYNATQDLNCIVNIDMDKDYYPENSAVRLTVNVEYRTNTEEEIDALEKIGINRERIEEVMAQALNQHLGIDEK